MKLEQELVAFCRVHAKYIPYLLLFVPLLAIPSAFLHPDAYTWVLVHLVKELLKDCVFTVGQAKQELRKQVEYTYLAFVWMVLIGCSSLAVRRYHQAIVRKYRRGIVSKAAAGLRSSTKPQKKKKSAPTTIRVAAAAAFEPIVKKKKQKILEPPPLEIMSDDGEVSSSCGSSSSDEEAAVETLVIEQDSPSPPLPRMVVDARVEEEVVVTAPKMVVAVTSPVVCKNQEPVPSVAIHQTTTAIPIPPPVIQEPIQRPVIPSAIAVPTIAVPAAAVANPCTPYELLRILQNPTCTDQQLHLLVGSGRVSSALLARMHPSDFAKAGISDFILRRLLSYVTRYSAAAAAAAPIASPAVRATTVKKNVIGSDRHSRKPPPGFSGGPKYAKEVRAYTLRSSTTTSRIIGPSVVEQLRQPENYERNMHEISNQMTMNVLDSL